MVGVIADAEPLLDQVADPPACPQPRAMAGGLGPLENPPDERAALAGGQLRRTARSRARLNPRTALLPIRALPATDGPPIDAQPLGHHVHRDASLQKFDGLETPTFEFSRLSCGRSASLPTGEIRTLLTRHNTS